MKIAGKTFYVFIIIITTIALLFSNPAPLKAQQIPTGQDVGARERAEEEARKKKEVTQKLIK